MEPTDRHRTVLLLNLAILAWIWIFSALTWADLPQRIPVHFDASGRPDGWVAKSWEHWFLVPAAALGLSVLLYAAAALAVRFPRLANVPRKRLFLSLAPEDRKPILDSLTGLVYRIAALVSVQFLVIQLGTYQVAKGLSRVLPWWVRILMVAVVAIILLLTVSTLLGIQSTMNRRQRTSLSGGNPGGGRG